MNFSGSWWIQQEKQTLDWAFSYPSPNQGIFPSFFCRITENRTYTYPDNSGVMALLSDVEAVANSVGSTYALTWYAETQTRGTYINQLCTLYTDPLPANIFPSDGSWATFSYVLNIAFNSNTKTVYVKFANQVILTISVSTSFSGYIYIEGKLKALQLAKNTWSYTVSWYSTGVAPTLAYGTLTGISQSVVNNLLLQGQGVANNDIEAIEGDGVINKVVSYAPNNM